MIDDQIDISINLKRKNHENGMTLKEYADGVIEGNLPILTCDEYTKQFGVLENEALQVLEWGRANNLTIIDDNLSMIRSMALIKYQGTFTQFNELFNIGLRVVSSGDRIYHTHDNDITMPQEIKDVVVSIFGLDNSRILESNNISEDTIEDINSMSIIPSANISNPTPIDLALAYKAPRTQAGNFSQGRGATVAIVGLVGGWTAQNLTSSFSRIGLSSPINNITDIRIYNEPGNDPSSPYSSRLMYDLYIIGSIVPAAKILIYYHRNREWAISEAINYILFDNNQPRASVINISMSWTISELNFDPSVLAACEEALQTAVILGVTVVVPSGSSGSQYGSECLYPASSPYVLCCGGTTATIDTTYNIVNEVVWNGGSSSSGGGVSSTFSRPTWQEGRTSKSYQENLVEELSGRGFPDIAAMAAGYTFYHGTSNTLITMSGNSAPLITGLIARINQMTGERVGFVNPFLYSIDNNYIAPFRDITSGNNATTNPDGYIATTGWDACTGLGSMQAGRVYRLKHTGETYPRANLGTRPIVGQAYPRITTGVRY